LNLGFVALIGDVNVPVTDSGNNMRLCWLGFFVEWVQTEHNSVGMTNL